MTHPETVVVTGAFSYTGKYITRRLLAAGKRVVTITDHPQPHPEITAFPYDLQNPERLAEHFAGATTFYNTYWVRFPHRGLTFDRAVENSRSLIAAAKHAGVRRIVHISISNASSSLRLPYFRGKGLVEETIMESGLSYAILRPTLVFGQEDILVNNIAWFLRRFPMFGVPGDGQYRVQPVYVDDLAELVVQHGNGAENAVVDAGGPETYTFEEFVRLLGSAIGAERPIVHLPPPLMHLISRLTSVFVKDVVLTRDEIDGLMAGLLYTTSQPLASTRFSEWVTENRQRLGASYQSELARHY